MANKLSKIKIKPITLTVTGEFFVVVFRRLLAAVVRLRRGFFLVAT